MDIFLSFYCLIKWFFHKYLGFFFCFFFVVVLSTFGLLSFYRRGIVFLLVAVFYLCEGDSDK